jgi:Lrp/AsnC family transcriptional regulator, regulator of ectoine-degradation genes
MTLAPRRAGVALDAIDIAILRHLERDGRISKSELAERVNLSKSACLERMRALERAKIVVSYHAKIDVRMIAPYEMFMTEVTLRSHRLYDFERFERYVAKIECVSECYALGGGIDYLLKVVTGNVDQYQSLIEKMLSDDVGVERYFTYIVTKVVKSTSGIPVASVLPDDRGTADAEKRAVTPRG